MQSFWELRHEFVDTFINCENGQSTFKAHKIILAAASPILREILKSSNILTFPDVSTCEMESAIESIYKGSSDSILKVGKLEKSLASQKPRKSAAVTQLPPEVLVNIFSFLPTTSLLKSIALVSKQFNNVTKLRSVHKVVHLSSFASNIANFLKSATLITKLQFFREGGCKRNKNRITTQKLVSSVQSHDHLQSLDFCNDLPASFLHFIPLSSSKWWTNLTRFNMEFSTEQYKELSILPEFDSALKELGSSGNLTHFGLGSLGYGSCSDAVNNFLLSPNLSKLRCLRLYDEYKWPMVEAISAARKESLELLYVLNIFSCIHIPNVPILKYLEIKAKILSLDNLPKLQELEILKIKAFERDCMVPPNSLPNLVHLEVGSLINYWSTPGLECHLTKVIHFYYIFINMCIYFLYISGF